MMLNKMDKDSIIQEIAGEFSKLPAVEAVALSGSKTGLINDELSDFDMYVYSKEPVPLECRGELASKYTNKYEVGNTFFEDGDELSLASPKMGVDIMYRRLEWAENEVDWVWRKHNAKVAYTTCFLHNVKTSRVLFDRDGRFQKLVDELNSPFPEELKKNIIAKNYPLLKTKQGASFYEQIEFALKRNDYVSQNHRTAALLASYFDILFAFNGQTHPGEKKLTAYAEKLCRVLPANFKPDVENVVKAVGTPEILPALDKLLKELDLILGK